MSQKYLLILCFISSCFSQCYLQHKQNSPWKLISRQCIASLVTSLTLVYQATEVSSIPALYLRAPSWLVSTDPSLSIRKHWLPPHHHSVHSFIDSINTQLLLKTEHSLGSQIQGHAFFEVHTLPHLLASFPPHYHTVPPFTLHFSKFPKCALYFTFLHLSHALALYQKDKLLSFSLNYEFLITLKDQSCIPSSWEIFLDSSRDGGPLLWSHR